MANVEAAVTDMWEALTEARVSMTGVATGVNSVGASETGLSATVTVMWISMTHFRVTVTDVTAAVNSTGGSTEHWESSNDRFSGSCLQCLSSTGVSGLPAPAADRMYTHWLPVRDEEQ